MMMHYSVLQAYSKTTGNPLYMIQNVIQGEKRRTVGVRLSVCQISELSDTMNVTL